MTDDQFEKLAQLIQTSHEDLSARMDRLTLEVHELREAIDALRSELGQIRTQLEALEEKVGQQSGYAKEIDHLLMRVSTIEQKLGIQATANNLQ